MNKAITLWNPWAILAVTGDKQFETRSWSTNYRGPLFIHSSKRFDAEIAHICLTDPFRTCLKNAGFIKASDIPCGFIVGQVDLVNIFGTEYIVGDISEKERAFGNYQPKRYAWQLENPVRFSDPIPMSGRQGLWTLTDEELLLLPQDSMDKIEQLNLGGLL